MSSLLIILLVVVVVDVALGNWREGGTVRSNVTFGALLGETNGE
jgi:hypothetical protein